MQKEKKDLTLNLINKTHRQTIEAFSEKGVWEIGISEFKTSF